MKKKFFYPIFLLMLICICTSFFYGCSTNNKTAVKKIKLNEVVRSVFYAPFYVAVNNGYFKEEGLDIDLSIGQGADKTMQEVLSKNADIGFCGPEQSI